MSKWITPEDRRHLLEEGWLAVADVVPREVRESVISSICEFLKVDPNDTASWYQHTLGGHGIVPLHHHQALWDVRQLPSVYELFTEVYETPELWVTMDRVSFKAPADERWPDSSRMSPFHWDGDPRQKQLMVQGLVFLTDTEPHQGGVAFLPDLYKQLDAWTEEPHSEEEWRRPDCSPYPVTRVPGKAGTVVVWHRNMPHTSALNRGTKPRFVQYVTMSPAGNDDERAERVQLWRNKIPPPWAVRQNVPMQQNPEPGDSPTLTALGRKLVGVEPW